MTTEQLRKQRTVDQRVQARRTPSFKVAYVMARFPKLSETFVLNEMLALR